jgi:hypothetical protein
MRYFLRLLSLSVRVRRVSALIDYKRARASKRRDPALKSARLLPAAIGISVASVREMCLGIFYEENILFNCQLKLFNQLTVETNKFLPFGKRTSFCPVQPPPRVKPQANLSLAPTFRR